MISRRERTQTRQAGAIRVLRYSLPPLETQRAIVARWQAAQAEADAAEERVKQVEAEIDSRFLADLGIKSHGAVDRPRVLAVRWKQLDKWGVRQTTDVLLGLDHLPSGNYPFIPIGDVRSFPMASKRARPTGRENMRAPICEWRT